MRNLLIETFEWLQKAEDRKKIHERWEDLIENKVCVEGYPITKESISKETKKILVELVADSMVLYVKNNCMNERTLLLFPLLKKLLADKRCFDAISCIDYLAAGHRVSKKRKVKEPIRNKVIAHFWRIVSNYQQIILNDEKSNPLMPGEHLKE